MILPSFDFNDVVLVADLFYRSATDDDTHKRSDLEMSDASMLSELIDTLHVLGLNVHHYEGPAELSLNAHRHREDVVLTLYGGQRSRNRMALVPAICEAHSLRYIGPDTYGRIICQDKEVSKRLARDAGLLTPRWRVVRNANEVECLKSFPLPFVVKPLLEGSSIGISSRNIVTTVSEGTALSLEILDAFDQPVLIEEFVPGREVSFNCIQTRPVKLCAYSEIVVAGKPRYFDDHLFEADEKLYRKLERTVRSIDDELDPDDRNRLDMLVGMIEPYGYCRIDGKHFKGRFVFLEITPDAWIAPRGALAAGFINKGMSYPEVIAAVLASAPPKPRGR